MDIDLRQLYRQERADALDRHVRDEQQSRAARKVFDDSGRVNPLPINPLLPLVSFDWASSDTSPRRIPQPGILVLLTAYAATAPSGGNCTVGLRMLTPWSGEETIATCEIEPGQHFPTEPSVLALEVPAGGLLKQTVIVANGASGVSIFASMRVT